MVRADSRAQGGDCVRYPVLGQGDHVRVALDHDQSVKRSPIAAARGASGLVESIEFARLVKHRRLRRVEVLGTFVRIGHKASAEGHHTPPRVANREHDPGPEPVIGVPSIVSRHQPRRDHLVRVRVQSGLQVVPSRRREADTEPVRGFAVETALFQVVNRFGMIAQGAVVKLCCLLQQFVKVRVRLRDPCAAFSRDLDVGDVRQGFDGVDELHAVVLDQEGQRRPADAAAETLIEAPFRIDVERGGFLLMEGTAGLVGLASPGQFHARVDEVDDVDPLEQIVNEGLRNATGHYE